MVKEKKVKEQTMQDILDEANKELGQNLQLFDGTPVIPCDAISTGSMVLDKATGIWGYPKGRIVELFGPESSGKTTLALSGIAQFNKLHPDVLAGYIDAEHALDKKWAKNLGVELNRTAISQPDSGEKALRLCEFMINKGFGMIIIDSVAALIPQAEIDGEIGDVHMALQARMMSQAIKKIVAAVHKTDCCVIFINQIREKPGVMYGPKETTPGGRALKFYASMRLEVKRGETIKLGDVAIGNAVTVKVVKNKVAPPFDVAKFSICYGRPCYPVFGIDNVSSVLNLAVASDVIEKTGSWYAYKEIRLGNGEAQVCMFLRNNPTMLDEISAQIKESFKSNPVESPADITGISTTEDDQVDNG